MPPLHQEVAKMNTASFRQRKERILSQLQLPDNEYSDLSPKGSLDQGIRDLVNQINGIDGLVTTSSCAGRVSVFLEGVKKDSILSDGASIPESSSPAIAGPGGKGGGRWLFISHDPIVTRPECDADRGYYRDLFGLQPTGDGQDKNFHVGASLVHFKFEAMILHVMASGLDDAQHILSAAQQAGFRESGAMSLGHCPKVAVRSTGLALDSPVAFQNSDGPLTLLVDDEYLHMLVSIANERFAVNRERIQRFQAALCDKFSSTNGQLTRRRDTDWEDDAIRRERKQREGIAQQRALRSHRETSLAEATDDGDSLELRAMFDC